MLAAIVALAAATAPANDPLLLVVTETRGYVHDSIPAARAELERLGRRSARFDVRTVGAARGLTAARLRGAAGVVFLSTTGELRLDAAARRRLLRFVARGGGFAGFHAAADSFARTFPEYRRDLLGAHFRGHPAIQEGRVVVTGGRHAVTRGLPRSFRIVEEFYGFGRLRRGSRVLLRLDAGSLAEDPPGDRAYPLAWVRRYGRGRVLYDALGHRTETWTDPRHRRLVADGLAWIVSPASGR